MIRAHGFCDLKATGRRLCAAFMLPQSRLNTDCMIWITKQHCPVVIILPSFLDIWMPVFQISLQSVCTASWSIAVFNPKFHCLQSTTHGVAPSSHWHGLRLKLEQVVCEAALFDNTIVICHISLVLRNLAILVEINSYSSKYWLLYLVDSCFITAVIIHIATFVFAMRLIVSRYYCFPCS